MTISRELPFNPHSTSSERIARLLFRVLAASTGLIVFLAGTGWSGLQIEAPRFGLIPPGAITSRIPLPDTLPAPVERFARTIFGDDLPVVETAIVVGRARLAPSGLAMPTRFRFYYDAVNSNYYHDIQVTWFTLPVMQIHERNLDGHSILDLSVLGRVEDHPNINQAAIQGYWTEVLAWVPSIPLSDSRIRWEAVNATTARMILPGLNDDGALTVHFDADSGLITNIETMRYQNENDTERSHWNNQVIEWGQVDGLTVAARAQTQWEDNAPWAMWEIEQVVFNVDVSARLTQFGGDVPE